jgi:hypothetical protein
MKVAIAVLLAALCANANMVTPKNKPAVQEQKAGKKSFFRKAAGFVVESAVFGAVEPEQRLRSANKSTARSVKP